MSLREQVGGSSNGSTPRSPGKLVRQKSTVEEQDAAAEELQTGVASYLKHKRALSQKQDSVAEELQVGVAGHPNPGPSSRRL